MKVVARVDERANQTPMTEKRDRDWQSGNVAGDLATEEAVRELVNRIVERVHPLRIILFGSVARGQSSDQSDVDLLVVMPEGAQKRRTAQLLYRHLRGLTVAVDLVVTTQGDLEQHKRDPGMIYQAILEEGKELYAA